MTCRGLEGIYSGDLADSKGNGSPGWLPEKTQETDVKLWGPEYLENVRTISSDHRHFYLYFLDIGMHEFDEVHGLLPRLFLR